MILYVCWGWTEDPRAMADTCRFRKTSEKLASGVYGRYQDAAWAMVLEKTVEDVGTFYEREGLAPVFYVTMEGPSASCEGEYSLRWAVRDEDGGNRRYCWARKLGYAIHVGPSRYLIRA